MKASSNGARLRQSQYRLCVLVLAASEHRQWAGLQKWVIPLLEKGKHNTDSTAQLSALAQGHVPGEINDQIQANAKTVISLIGGVVEPLAWAPDPSVVANQRLGQFAEWVRIAQASNPSAYTLWKLRCRTSFLGLAAAEREPYYPKAEQLLTFVAKRAGLILPDPVPPVSSLLSDGHVQGLRLGHGVGLHGLFNAQELGGDYVCQACGGDGNTYA